MTDKMFFSSLTRISDLRERPFELVELPRERWRNGDYVGVSVRTHPRGFDRVELQSGRMAEVGRGARIVGALGVRHATLEATGSFEAVGEDGRMHLLTSGGLLGRVTSLSNALKSLLAVEYAGHVVRGGRPVRMRDFAAPVAVVTARSEEEARGMTVGSLTSVSMNPPLIALASR